MTAIDTPFPVEQMTQEQVDALLATLTSLDGRLALADAGTAAIRARAWWTLLGECDPSWALNWAVQAYAVDRTYPLTPAEVLEAWRATQTVVTQAEETQARRAYQRRVAPDAVWEYLRSVLDAMRGGQTAEVALAATPRPEWASTIDPEWDRRTRRCRYHAICACDHRNCRDGWLDAPGRLVTPTGEYETAERCPHCKDALLMAEERGIAKKPRRYSRR